MKLSDFKPGDRVVYVPNHAFGDKNHEDSIKGTVSSVNGYCVFVRFDQQVEKFGWEGTTAQGCQLRNLEKERA